MGSLNKRAGVLQRYVEAQVQARMEAEIEAMLDALEAKLNREEFLKFAQIIMDSREDANGA